MGSRHKSLQAFPIYQQTTPIVTADLQFQDLSQVQASLRLGPAIIQIGGHLSVQSILLSDTFFQVILEPLPKLRLIGCRMLT